MEELRLESGILGIPGPAFCCPIAATPSTVVSRNYRFRVGCWLVTRFPRGASPGIPPTHPPHHPPPTERFGTVKGRNCARKPELGGAWAGLLFSFLRQPIYGGFAYLASLRLVLGVNVHFLWNAPRAPAGPSGALRSGK